MVNLVSATSKNLRFGPACGTTKSANRDRIRFETTDKSPTPKESLADDGAAVRFTLERDRSVHAVYTAVRASRGPSISWSSRCDLEITNGTHIVYGATGFLVNAGGGARSA